MTAQAGRKTPVGAVSGPPGLTAPTGPTPARLIANWPQPPVPADICFSLTLDVEPVAKERPRVSPAEYTVIAGRKVKTRKAHGYTPKPTSDYEDRVGWLLRQAHVRCADTGDLGLRAVFYLGAGHRPDADNLVKALLDAGNGIGWGDDKQFVQQVVDVVRGSNKPRVELTVYRVATLARIGARP